MKQLPMHNTIEPFGKDIFFMESTENVHHKLPFYADGFAGIIYSRSKNSFYQQPFGKKLSPFYLYGQTLHPISLEVEGPYELYCVRLFPFTVRLLLDVDPKELKDDCYDLNQIKNINTKQTIEQLDNLNNNSDIVNVLAGYFSELLVNASSNPDYRIKLALNLILKSKGTITIKELREKLAVNERTLERHFLRDIGVTPKQFTKIIQFSSSMQQISDEDYVTLTDISYDNGFADQSHFIRTFKQFTGKTPKGFLKTL